MNSFLFRLKMADVYFPKSLERMNSNPSKNNEDAESVYSRGGSLFIAGNLNESCRKIEDFYTDEDDEEDEVETDSETSDHTLFEPDDIGGSEMFKKADDMLFDIFGVRVLQVVATSLLAGSLSSTDLLIQALAYKCQRITRGTRGVRYKDSWGMFWCGVRMMIKGRGLVPFLEHFEIPSKLSKFKTKIMKICGLEKETLGKPGLQVQNTHLWLQGKKTEIGSFKTLCLSISLDGKKIAVSANGEEDMAGIGETETRKQIDAEFEKEKSEVIKNIESNSRDGLYKLYDAFSLTAKDLVSKIVAIEKLIEKNTKQLSKNPVLSKYIYVLNQQLLIGDKILIDLDKIQTQIIQHVSSKRNCLALLPDSCCALDLSAQTNYLQLDIEKREETLIMASLDFVLSSCSTVLHVPWDQVLSVMSIPVEKIPVRNPVSDVLYQSCYILAKQTFGACGLSMMSPLQDMKKIYHQARERSSDFEKLEKANDKVVATFCSNFSAMTFGQNAMVREAGIFIENGFCATPELLVVNTKDSSIDYIVLFNAMDCTNTFVCTQELLATSLVSMKICRPLKGCIIINYSKRNLVAFSLSTNIPLAESFISFIEKYVNAPKCLGKRTKVDLATILSFRTELRMLAEKVTTLGAYPVVDNVISSSVQTSVNRCSNTSQLKKDDFVQLLEDRRKYLAKQARELIVCNISDLSGNSSKFPHTICGATFLSSASLKVVVRDCLKATRKMIEEDSASAQVLNFGLDGESLHLLTSRSNGEPGTVLALSKYLLNLVKNYKKIDLVKILAKNKRIDLNAHGKDSIEAGEENEEEIDDVIDPEDLMSSIHDNIDAVQYEIGVTGFCLDDVDDWLSTDGSSKDASREEICRTLTIKELRMIALKYILPKAKKEWLHRTYGSESISVMIGEQIIDYVPSTIFDKSEAGYFITLTFDMAHISNLLRESVAKNKLKSLGLERQSLDKLCAQPEFKYLKKILKLKNNKLEYDSMNQKASAICFSKKTEDGLREISDEKGANCCMLLRKGIIEALDVSGVSSETRVEDIYKLKTYIDEKINPIDRIHRPGGDAISNELLQMINCSLDSHLVSFLNMSHFNARRKGTLTVEQFFGAITLMADGGSKLHCRQINDILERVMMSNALRMVPESVKGFKFLSLMKVHMKSYEAEAEDEEGHFETEYPSLFLQRKLIMPIDAPQDKQSKKRKRSVMNIKEKDKNYCMIDEIGVRKFHKKF